MVLSAWIVRSGRNAMAGSNIALRWDRSKPSTGVDPDVYLVEPAPPKGEAEKSLCLSGRKGTTRRASRSRW
ncbi:MAG: hypothetical protein IPF99_17095 [Deltaproteobacteria bacterium]|nr:hypothetical protein [Deltaproteobacteria bacterium]